MWRNPCTECKKGQLKKNHRKRYVTHVPATTVIATHVLIVMHRSDSSEEFITDLHDEEVKLIH